MTASIELSCILGLLLVFHFLIIPWHVETVKEKAVEIAGAMRDASSHTELSTVSVQIRAEEFAAASLGDIKSRYYLIVLVFFIVLTFLVMLVSLNIYRRIISPVSLIAAAFTGAGPGRAELLSSLAGHDDEIGGLAREYMLLSEKTERAINEMRDSEKKIAAGEMEEKNALIAELNEKNRELSALNEKLLSGVEEVNRARQAMLENDSRHRAIAESTFDVSCETDIGGNYLYVSPNNEKMLGFKPEDFIGRNFSEFVHPDDIPAAFGAFQKGLQGLKADAVLRFRHRDGHYVWIESTGAYYQTATGEVRAIIVSRDITARRRLEEETIRAEKLDAINKLAGGIAHDFNNIITSLTGNMILLRKNAGDAKKFEEITERIEKIIKRAAGLTRELAADSEGVSIATASVDLNLLLRSVAEGLPNLKELGIRYNLELKDGLWPAFVDGEQVSRMVAGIIGNACSAMPDGGDIEVKTDNLMVFENDRSLMTAGRYVKISFKDTRRGVDNASAAKIFDPYYCREGQKDGLELFNAYAIVKKHQGYMTASADADRGLVFDIYFAASGEAKNAAAEDTPGGSRAAVKKAKVLLMDDDDEILQSLSENLAEEGYRVGVSLSGEEAFETYKAHFESGDPFDVVVLDLIVPGGAGGAETVKKLFEIDSKVRAIVSSGYSNDPVMAEYRKFGFSGVIAKPYEIRSLCEIIDSLAKKI
jgi:PAS domain S-box-containing protein